jgi:hypothetical protein
MRFALALLAAALIVVATASGAAKRTVVLKIGDAVDVRYTGVACFALHSNGKDGIGCLLWAKGKPAAGTYGAGLAADGTAVINKLAKDGTGITIWKRKLQSAGTTYHLTVGDEFGLILPGNVDLGCRIVNVTSTSIAAVYRGTKVSCWRAKDNKPLPNTYGVTLSDKLAGVFKINAASEVSSWAVLKREP